MDAKFEQSLVRIRELNATMSKASAEINSILDGLLHPNQAGDSPSAGSVVADTIPKVQAGEDKAVWRGTVDNSGFKFSASSQKELQGVNVDLVRCVHLALKYSTQDFTVFDGIRTVKEQQQHVANGTSKTMQSKHLDGLAVDLVPWIQGKPVWDWDGCYKIALAMDRAATELGIAHRITWGGAWDRTLADFGGDPGSYEQEVRLYRSRTGKTFIDGPHFEIRGK